MTSDPRAYPKFASRLLEGVRAFYGIPFQTAFCEELLSYLCLHLPTVTQRAAVALFVFTLSNRLRAQLRSLPNTIFRASYSDIEVCALVDLSGYLSSTKVYDSKTERDLPKGP